MPKGSTTEDPTTEAPAESGASPVSDLELRAMILRLSSQVEDLTRQVQEQDDRVPMFQPSRTRMDYASYFEGMERGKPFEREGDRRYIVGTDSHPISDAELKRTPPRFRPNEYVRLNLEAPAHDSEQSWNEVVKKVSERQKRSRKRLPSTVGRVLYINYRRDSGSYKYRCVFPGLTGLVPDKDRGDGFDEDELLPMEGAA